MSRWKYGDHRFERKHFWLPCVISARFDDMTDEEKAAAYKAAYWADLVANNEWPALLGHDDATRAARYRLRRKAVGWLMALGRMAARNPKLFAEVREKAATLYRDQLEREHPFLGSEREFEIDGEEYVYTWTPGPRSTDVELPDGRTARVTVEVGRVLSAEIVPAEDDASRPPRDADEAAS